MSAKTCACALALMFAFALQSRAALIISEVVFNEVGSDVTGEWVEIFNEGPAVVALDNYKIGDEETQLGTGTTEAIHRFPVGATIAPGELQIVAVSATRFNTVYGLLPTYEVNPTNGTVPDMLGYLPWDADGGAMNMSNTNDQIVLINPTDMIIDAASWGSSTFAFNPALGAALDGQSYQRKNVYIDTNTADDWETVPGDTAAERSTPFSAPIPEPATLTSLFAVALGFLAYRRRR